MAKLGLGMQVACREAGGFGGHILPSSFLQGTWMCEVQPCTWLCPVSASSLINKSQEPAASRILGVH